MDNVGIVVDDLGRTIDFFRELGLEVEGRATIEGEWAGRVTGLANQRVEIAMMRTPDGQGRLELSRFLTPLAVADHRNAPVNALVTSASCSPWMTSMRRLKGYVSTAHSSWAK
jgi:catechol 2,3-dioxygenase-like lactoylglutathione lyase family enzyme